MVMQPEVVWKSKGVKEHLTLIEQELKGKVDPVLRAHLSQLRRAWGRPRRVRLQSRKLKNPATKAA